MQSTPENDNTRVQAGEVFKPNTAELALSFGDEPAVKPPLVTGQTAQVLALIRKHGPILNVDLKLTYGVTEAAARVFELIELGFNILRVRVRVGTRYCHGRIRKGLVAYGLGHPEWIPPNGGR